MNTFCIGEYGDIEVKNVMVDVGFNCLEEGIDIIFTEENIPTITIVGCIDLDSLTVDELEKLIEDNI
jgi:hypothetical protein